MKSLEYKLSDVILFQFQETEEVEDETIEINNPSNSEDVE